MTQECVRQGAPAGGAGAAALLGEVRLLGFRGI